MRAGGGGGGGGVAKISAANGAERVWLSSILGQATLTAFNALYNVVPRYIPMRDCMTVRHRAPRRRRGRNLSFRARLITAKYVTKSPRYVPLNLWARGV